jgi:transposase InsO family protein
VDASNWAAGGTLSQIGDDGALYPVAYFSAKHSAQECNYDIYDKELLAVIKALEEWQPELEGTKQPFQVVTDHKNLQTFATTKQLSPRHMRWSEFLSRFNFRITYRPGTLNTRPDALSRKPEDTPSTESDDRLRARRKALIDPAKFDPSMLSDGGARMELRSMCATEAMEWELQLCAIDTSRHIDDLIEESYARSPLLKEIIEAITDPDCRKWPPHLKKRLRIPFAECTTVAGKAYFRGRIILDPDDQELQLQAVHRTHAAGPGGHPGRVKTIDLMNRKYWWPGMSVAVRKYCKGCLLCDKAKNSRSAPVGFLKPLPLPLSPWKDISVDYITPLPACERRGQVFKHIAVVVDRLTKMRHFIPTVGLKTEELVDRFVERIYSLHGLPDTIVSDRGSQFVSVLWGTLSKRLGITLKPSSAYHPETNGQTERINAELEQYLRLYIDWAMDDWVDWLPLAEFAGNNAASETTGMSPFFANYGFNPRMGVEPASPCSPELTAAQRAEFFKGVEIANRFKAILDKLTAFSRQSQDRYEENANRRRTDAPQYHTNDLVMLHTGNLKTGRPTEKLAPRWEGPFRVLKASSHAVTLALPQNMKIKNTFHVKLVRRWEQEGMPGQELAEQEVRANRGRIMSRTDDFQEVEEWEFEDILDYGKSENGRWHYQIKWKDYEEPTWQPATDLKGCDERIWQFHDAHPDLPPPPQWVRRRKRKESTEEPPKAQETQDPQQESAAPAPERRSRRRTNKTVRFEPGS